MLETVPASIPIEFLIDSSAGHLEAIIDGFRPHIVIISGHGHYDDLRGEHYLSVSHDRYLSTAQLVALCTSYGCKLLVLFTCESARLGGPVIDDGTILPADLIAFSFPVRTTTATESLTCLFEELVQGRTVEEAVAAVRALDTRPYCERGKPRGAAPGHERKPDPPGRPASKRRTPDHHHHRPGQRL